MRLEEGESLRKSAAAEGVSPSRVLAWKDQFPEFAEQYARAREVGYRILADEILDIANTPQIGEIRTTKADGGVEIKMTDMIEHRRLQVDARKWMLSKMLPKVYGDKLALAGDESSPLTVVVRKLAND